MADPKVPFNVQIMDVDDFITRMGCLEVTSPFIHESSSNTFHPQGLFSEQIFGEIASDTRLIKHGFIRLNCRVLHPTIFQNLQALKRFYTEIMSGKSFAKWDPVEHDFVRAFENEEGADTGYTFFLKHFSDIEFLKNRSLKRNDKIDILRKYKDRLFITKCLVLPAGIRDMKETEGRMEKDSINTLYSSLLNSTRSMPPTGDNDPIYDSIHYSIQRKILEIYEYITNMIEGKTGFFQSRLGARAIASSTRNVITATSLEAESPSSPQFHRCTESKIPLFQAAKGYASLVVYHLKALFYAAVVTKDSEKIAAIDPVSKELEYIDIDSRTRDDMTTEEGIQKTIDLFRDPQYRYRPVTVRNSSNNTQYWLYIVYDDKDKIYIFRNLAEFKEDFGDGFDEKKIRPLSHIEMMYIATAMAANGRSGTITRHPVTDEQSIYPSLTHVVSTNPARVVTLVTDAKTKAGPMLPEYPSIGAQVIDVLQVHPAKLKGLGGDFDGDTVSWIPIMSEEANKECADYYQTDGNFTYPNGAPTSAVDDLCQITMHTMTMDVPELKKK